MCLFHSCTGSSIWHLETLCLKAILVLAFIIATSVLQYSCTLCAVCALAHGKLSCIFRCTCIAGERTALHAGSASSTGNAALDEIIKRLSMDEGGLNTMNNNKTHYVPQVMVFPEGTCGNSNVLFRFNKGPFSLGKPVQMACFQYPYRYVDDNRAPTKLQTPARFSCFCF